MVIEWENAPLKAICIKIQDGTHFSPAINGGKYLYVTSRNIGYGTFDISDAQRIDAYQHAKIYERCDVKYGDLLLTKDGANTGNAALNTLLEEFSLLSSVAFLRFDPNQHDARFYLQQILSYTGQQQIKDAMSGNAITRLTLEKIKNLSFIIAPLPEQTAIAEALSDADSLISSLEKLIAKKTAIKQGAMQELLTGKKRLPGFSGEWAQTHLGNVGYLSKESLNPQLYPNTPFSEYSMPAFDEKQLPNIVLGRNMLSSRLKIADNVLLFNKLNVRQRRIWLIEKCGSNAVCSSEFLPYYSESIELTYLKQLLFTDKVTADFEGMSTGTSNSQKRIVPWDLLSYQITMPPIKEQTAIASILSDMDAEIEQLEKKLAKYRLLKQGMMQELLTGRIRLMKGEY